MTGKEYVKTQLSLIAIGKQSSLLDIDGFLASIGRAEAVAPLLDPTLYRKASENMNALRELARAIKEVKTQFLQVQEAVAKTSVAQLIDQASQPKTPGEEAEPAEPNLFV